MVYVDPMYLVNSFVEPYCNIYMFYELTCFYFNSRYPWKISVQ